MTKYAEYEHMYLHARKWLSSQKNNVISAYVLQRYKIARQEGESVLNEVANEQCLQARRRKKNKAKKATAGDEDLN